MPNLGTRGQRTPGLCTKTQLAMGHPRPPHLPDSPGVPQPGAGGARSAVLAPGLPFAVSHVTKAEPPVPQVEPALVLAPGAASHTRGGSVLLTASRGVTSLLCPTQTNKRPRDPPARGQEPCTAFRAPSPSSRDIPSTSPGTMRVSELKPYKKKRTRSVPARLAPSPLGPRHHGSQHLPPPAGTRGVTGELAAARPRLPSALLPNPASCAPCFLCRDEPADFKEKQFAGILLARRVPTPTRRSRLCGQETRALMLPDTRRGCRLVVSGSARAGLGLVPPRTAAVSRGPWRPPAGIGSGFALGRARGRETASTWGVSHREPGRRCFRQDETGSKESGDALPFPSVSRLPSILWLQASPITYPSFPSLLLL